MLEDAHDNHRISKEEYAERAQSLRVDLLNAQFDLRRADFPVVLILSGDDRIGFHDMMNCVHEWMDARYMDARVHGRPHGADREGPVLARMWRDCPSST